MMEQQDTPKDYVEANVNDMRRTKDVNEAMAMKLTKQEEESKLTVAKRPSRDQAKLHRKSILMTQLSFAPMKPVVETRAIETQTDSEPIKTYSSMDTQTEEKETTSIRI